MLVTVLSLEEFAVFFFIIWHNKFPESQKNHGKQKKEAQEYSQWYTVMKMYLNWSVFKVLNNPYKSHS